MRAPEDLNGLDGLIFPGGESTVMSRLCERYDLFEPLQQQIRAGLPAFGTCAGLIFLARSVAGASQNFAQKTLGVLDVGVERNAYGAQIDSFETDLMISDAKLQINESTSEGTGESEKIRAVFIRAPRIARVGEGVEVLARYEDAPVIVRQGAILALSFHPEIAGEHRLHRMWLGGAEKFREAQS